MFMKNGILFNTSESQKMVCNILYFISYRVLKLSKLGDDARL
jgi:hypothetical protein